MTDPRLAQVADLLVRYSVRVRAGDLVKITGAAVTEPLLVQVYAAVLRAGGNPYVAMTSEACAEELLRTGKGPQLDFASPLAQHEIETIDCLVSVWGGTNSRAHTHADPARQARANRSRQRWFATFMKRTAIPAGRKGNLRWVGTQFPTASSAQDAEMSLRDYEDFVYDACLLGTRDPIAAWKQVRARQARMTRRLDRVRTMRFRTPRGTDLTVGLEGRTWMNCDGSRNFPDGEVCSAPLEDATEGVVCYDFPAVYAGREVEGIRLRFRGGRVVDASASKNEAFLVKMLDQDPGARILGEIAIGTNYRIQRHTKNILFDEKIGGTFHAAVGASIADCGGRNHSALHWDMVGDLRRGGTIEADGRLISRDGRFTIAGWPGRA